MATTEIKETRSGVDGVNLQEVLDANEGNGKDAWRKGQQQYASPADLAEHCMDKLPSRTLPSYGYREMAFDPQCAGGNLVKARREYKEPHNFGFEIDKRFEPQKNRAGNALATDPVGSRITGHCVKAMPVVQELLPDVLFDIGAANPPFGLKWKQADGTMIDSTEWTWKTLLATCKVGFLIANEGTLQKLGIPGDPHVTAHEVLDESPFDGVEVTIGIVWFKGPRFSERRPHERWTIQEAFDNAQKILDEEKTKHEHNVWLGIDGKLKTYLSTRMKLKVTRQDINLLTRIDKTHPLTLTTEKETRDVLQKLLDCEAYTIQPAAERAIRSALEDCKKAAIPMTPVSDFELVAYADEEDKLECVKDFSFRNAEFRAGKTYPIRTISYNFVEPFQRTEAHFNAETGETYPVTHDCHLQGTDRAVRVSGEGSRPITFKSRPDEKKAQPEVDESKLWEIFKRPERIHIGKHPEYRDKVEKNKRMLENCEELADFTFYPGQKDFYATVGAKDYGLIAAETGTGKTLGAITLINIKGPKRALIVAPQGTMRGEDKDDEPGQFNASQWVQEIRRFAPHLPIFELYSREDWDKHCAANGGTAPFGVFISYYEAMFRNKARESIPESWGTERLCKEMKIDPPPKRKDPVTGFESREDWCEGIGEDSMGIRCIAKPCLATQIGHEFEMVLLDESHIGKSQTSQVNQMMIRLQPKYRYALTATPITNVATDIFAVLGWLCVPGWYMGGVRNVAWPYAKEDQAKFAQTFLCFERDLTKEQMRRAKDPDWSGKCMKKSPIISSPARLLKLVKPTLAFISKQDCNPDLPPLKLTDVEVPMGKQQCELYGHFLQTENVPHNNPMTRAAVQVSYLRGICADPAGFPYGGPRVSTNFNPKAMAALSLIHDMLERGEQCVVVSARCGQSAYLEGKLGDCGIPTARIDSTVPPKRHSRESNRFKQGGARVMFMGIKCAQSYSFSLCPNIIIMSLEYTSGSLEQALGRVYRVDSKQPVNAYLLLHKNSIEQVMRQTVWNKADSATLVLRGKRVSRDFVAVTAGQLIAASLNAYDPSRQGLEDEDDLLCKWPTLQRMLEKVGQTKNS